MQSMFINSVHETKLDDKNIELVIISFEYHTKVQNLWYTINYFDYFFTLKSDFVKLKAQWSIIDDFNKNMKSLLSIYNTKHTEKFQLVVIKIHWVLIFNRKLTEDKVDTFQVLI